MESKDMTPPEAVKSLENLLKMKVKPKTKGKLTEVSPEFRVTVNEGRNGAPHMMIHADGHDSDTLDFTVVGNKIIPHFTNTDASGMNFGEALECMQRGDRVAREGWNGKDMFLVYVPGTDRIETKKESAYHNAGVLSCEIGAHIDICTADGTMQPGWLASQSDMLAGDWLIVTA